MSAAGLAVLERNRLAQGTIAATVVSEVIRLMPLLWAKQDIESNIGPWLQALLQVIGVRRSQSAALAAQMLTAYRVVELGPEALSDGFTIPAQGAMNVEQVTTSLMVLGPQAYRSKVAKRVGKAPGDVTFSELLSTTLSPTERQVIAANVAGSAMRHVSNGDRLTSDFVMENDPRVVGYVRVTDGDPCWFCAMLASRGPVYDGDSFDDSDPRFHGPGNHKVHDSCGCTLKPLYKTENPEFLERTREYEALWKATGNARDFRRAYEARRR